MFRRSGSVIFYAIEGAMPDLQSDSFAQNLAKHRFRSIENAASEETSVGWVTQADPSGNSFELEDMDFDGKVWMRFRIDKKAIPTKWMAIHRTAAERAEGRKLTSSEKKDLKEDLMQKLLPRVLPSINLVDLVYLPEQSSIMLFSTSQAVKEAFTSLFYKTFSTSLQASDPFQLALNLGLTKEQSESLDQVGPINWPSWNKKPEAADLTMREGA